MSWTLYNIPLHCIVSYEVRIYQIGEEKIHGESKVIQRCFDDNKGDDKKLKDQSKNNSSESKINQITTQVNQEQFKSSR